VKGSDKGGKAPPAADTGMTRRDFIRAAGLVLPSIAFLGLGSLAEGAPLGQGQDDKSPAAGKAGSQSPQRAGCNWACAGGCAGQCGRGCSYGCDNTCRGSCYQTCTGSCERTCRGSCSSNCGSGCSGSCSGGCRNMMR
jgi:hypothetical protein